MSHSAKAPRFVMRRQGEAYKAAVARYLQRWTHYRDIEVMADCQRHEHLPRKRRNAYRAFYGIKVEDQPC